MGHTHHNLNSTAGRLIITMLLNFVITIAEVIGGILSGSLALISDALHNFSDGISVIISYIALKLKKKESSEKHTFGLKRAEILAAVFNSFVLIVISVYLFYEAAQRFTEPKEIDAGLMTLVASIGLIANIAGTLLLKRDSKDSLNIRSSYLHLLSDAVSSFAVILGGLVIYFYKIYWMDPLLTILIGIYIIRESILILLSATHVLMEGAPANVTIKQIETEVLKIDEVKNIHHIHLWTVGENDIHLEAHIKIPDMMLSKGLTIKDKVASVLLEKFKINHITLQMECNACDDVGLINNH